ncbi:hypothetical protein OAN24_06355 [Pseudodesulfovibrio sp.]|nr:hypothetical protein [Pseudodesulfovibrio sp.]
MKIKVGVPFAKHGRITDETLNSLKELGKCTDFEVEVVAQQGSNVPRARNAMINGEKSNLVQQTLTDFDYFLCVDADTGFTVEHVKQLLAHDENIVSGAYVHKHDASRIVAGWFKEIEGVSRMEDRVDLDATGLIEVDWVGAGFMLLKRKALEAMPYPWFSCDEIQYNSDKGPCAQVVSDDLGFCIKARKNGQKIMLDADCRVDHVHHPNEHGGTLSDALNDLLRNRETIIRHVKAMGEENQKLKQMLGQQAEKKD